MSGEGCGNEGASPQELPFDRASALLRLAVEDDCLPGARPFNELATRLRDVDGENWLDTAMDQLSEWSGQPTLLTLPTQPLPLADLKAAKAIFTEKAQDANAVDKLHIATLGYFMVLAAALAHHRTKTTSRDEETVRTALECFAQVLPPNWASLFRKAVTALNSPNPPEDSAS